MKPHKYSEAIKAWADGADIQVRRINDDVWVDISSPAWLQDFEYRIKPTLQYRVALHKISRGFATVSYDKYPDSFDGIPVDGSFVRWLTDWVNVEF